MPDARERTLSSDTDEQDLQDGRDFSRISVSRRKAAWFGAFALFAVLFLYFILPKYLPDQISSLKESFGQVRENNASPGWLLLALIFEAISYVAYIWLFYGIFSRVNPRIGIRESYEISLAGVAATRLFAAAGAGGVALTYWAVRRSGVRRRHAAGTLYAFFAVLYGAFIGTVLLDGTLMYSGVLSGPTPFGLVAVPMIVAGTLLLMALSAALLPSQAERAVVHWAAGRGKFATMARKVVTAPAIMAEGARQALRLTRMREPALLGAPLWWAADVAVLWASFRAFGYTPSVGVLVMGYFVGMVANTIPVPGGIGAVEGGMIGAFAGFGVPTGIAITAVLTYRVFAFWFPTIPGALAYWNLRRTVDRWREDDATIKSEVLEPEATGSDPGQSLKRTETEHR